MQKLTKRKGFNFFRSYYDVYNELETTEDKVAFIDALLDRQFLGVKPTDLKGMAKFAYISQVNSIDSQVKGYEDKTKTILTPTVGGCVGVQIPPTEQVQVKEKEKLTIESILEKKKDDFVKALQPFKNNYDADLLNNFYFYWTETKPNSKLLRWEREKAFDIERRLGTWIKFKDKFNDKKQDRL